MVKEITAWLFLVSFCIQTAAQDYCNYYGDIRLVGVSSEREGRVEVCIGGVWGTVCDDGWDSNDARVVCRQLGYEVDVPRTYPSAYCCARYGQGTGPIYLDNLRCTGQESSLLDCWYNQNDIGNIRSCSHSEDAGIRCPSTTCIHDSVRLTGGLEPTEGRVEVCVGGRWRGVCGTNWNYQDAFVVCRQLGYPATGAVPYSGSSTLKFGRSVNATLTSFRCYGSELHLLRCTHSVGLCSRDYTVGVHCYGDVVPVQPQCFGNGNIRLVGGADTNEGRVEVCVNGMWGTVCGYGWDSRDAAVVCKQLGFQSPYEYVYTSSSMFGAGSGPIFLSYLNCQGSEHTLLECSVSSTPYNCHHNLDAGVRCENEINSGCTHSTIQLAGGQSATEGRVKICINGVWGSVCDDYWDSNDARVVCRQLRLPYTGAVAYSDAYFGSGSGPYHLDNVQCRGSEVSLLSCSHSAIGVHNCRPGNQAGVKCVIEYFEGNIEDDSVGGLTPYSESLPYTTADIVYVNISGKLPVTQRHLVYSSWYFNGLSSLPAGASVQSLLRLPTGVTQSMTIHNPTPLHAGTYEVLLLLNPVNYLRQFGCSNEYQYFITVNNRAGVYRIVVGQLVVNLEYYEPAAVSLQASRPALRGNENATLICTANGGYPPTSNISWVKNGRVISTSNANQLAISIAASSNNSFGQYVCLVNNSVTTTETTLLMKQKGDLVVHVELDQSSSEGCAALKNDSMEMLEAGIADTIQEMCSCNISPYDMEESQVTCSADSNSLTFTTTVVYSTESGNLTASTLIQLFQDRATGTVVLIANQTATVTRVCSPACIREGKPGSDVAAIVGACVGSLLIALIIAAVIVCVLALRRRKIPDGVQLGNDSVKSENVHYSTGGSSVQLEQNISVDYKDEVVYECPT